MKRAFTKSMTDTATFFATGDTKDRSGAECKVFQGKRRRFRQKDDDLTIPEDCSRYIFRSAVQVVTNAREQMVKSYGYVLRVVVSVQCSTP